jgi:two-component system cell cycle sensor histidine kinase/response regulator CckA
MHAPYDPRAASAEERNHRILIIDDNPSIHEDVRKILGAPAQEDCALDTEAEELFGGAAEAPSSAVFEIDSAFQGQEGMAMAQRALQEGRPYAMAFVDVRMPPGWDGIETISRIWKLNPEMQIVICTAYSDYSWEDMVRKVGKTDSLVVLKKPFDNVEVLQLAHTLTRKWTISNHLHSHLVGLDKIVAARTQDLQSANTQLRKEIEDRQQAEKELVLSEKRFEKAFQASPIPMAIQSLTTGRYVDVNEAFLSMTGYRRLQIISRTPKELRLYADPDSPSLLLLQLQEERSVRNFECRIRTHSGEIHDCVVSAEAFELADETVALVAAQDVSEQRKLELKLRHAQKLEAVGQFAAGVAHDFNNMLTVIQGHASIQLAAANLEKDLADSLNHVSFAAERAAALTRQLLTFSRKHVVQAQLLDVNVIIQNLHHMLSRVIGEHIELRCELDDDLPAIYADDSNIEQIVMNIAANARDAMPNGGRFTVQTGTVEIDKARASRHPQARLGRHVFLRFTDTGCGIASETLAHIFEPFFTTKEVGKGSGLGLATVYGIVSRQEGWIEITSEECRGATFEILLPVSEEKAAAAPESPDRSLPGGTETILVVEDEPAVREIISYVLRRQGYNVLEAGDGPEAIAIWSVQRGEVDLLVTDIIMPNGMKGNVLAEKLRAKKPGLKIMYSSAYSSDFATEAAPLRERVSFLEKPYKPEVLVRAVRECLDEPVACAR